MMGKIFSVIKRPFINFAVEERAARVIDKAIKTKPKMAPLYPTEGKVLKRIQREHPELMEKIKAKNDKLDAYLKQVTVKKSDFLPPFERTPSLSHDSHGATKLLPQERLANLESEFGMPEISDDKVPAGKLSFRQAMEIFLQIPFDASASPSQQQNVDDAKRLAVERYRLDDRNVDLILNYFRPFLLSKDIEDVLVRPSTLEEVKDPHISTSQMLQDSAEVKITSVQRQQEFRRHQAAQLKRLEFESEARKSRKEFDATTETVEELPKKDK